MRAIVSRSRISHTSRRVTVAVSQRTLPINAIDKREGGEKKKTEKEEKNEYGIATADRISS